MTTWPTTVDTTTVRLTAAFVAPAAVVAAVAADTSWLPAALLAGDFAVRVTLGPRAAPLSRLASTITARRGMAKRPSAVAPKRFAAGIGAALTAAASVAALWGAAPVAAALLVMVGVFATLEAVFGFCAGCVLYGLLFRAGVPVGDDCADCADITNRYVRHSASN